MKYKTDPRHEKRMKVVQDLFAQGFVKQKHNETLTAEIIKHQKSIDEKIQSAAPSWPLQKIAKVDLAILRLAIYELLIVQKEPPKVIIDEAVELAKELGGERSSSFINGVLGTILKEYK